MKSTSATSCSSSRQDSKVSCVMVVREVAIKASQKALSSTLSKSSSFRAGISQALWSNSPLGLDRRALLSSRLVKLGYLYSTKQGLSVLQVYGINCCLLRLIITVIPYGHSLHQHKNPPDQHCCTVVLNRNPKLPRSSRKEDVNVQRGSVRTLRRKNAKVHSGGVVVVARPNLTHTQLLEYQVTIIEALALQFVPLASEHDSKLLMSLS